MQNQTLILELIKALTADSTKPVEPISKPVEPISSDSAVKVEPTSQLSGRYIVISNRGNIVVGDLTQEGDMLHLTNASVIRRWGTTKGLGQLAMEGATNETVLDECGDFSCHLLTTCGLIKVTSDF